MRRTHFLPLVLFSLLELSSAARVLNNRNEQLPTPRIQPFEKRWKRWSLPTLSTELKNQPRGSGPRKISSSAVSEGLRNSIASGLAAARSKTLLAPFDTIKTVQQQMRQEMGAKTLSFSEAARLVMKRPKGVFELYVSKERQILSCKFKTRRLI